MTAQGGYTLVPGQTAAESVAEFGRALRDAAEEKEPRIYEIHISDMRTFKTCRQRWDYSSLLRRGWSHEAPQKHLWLGSTIHDALEVFYTPGEDYRNPDKLFETFESIVEEDFDEYALQDLTNEQWKELDD